MTFMLHKGAGANGAVKISHLSSPCGGEELTKPILAKHLTHPWAWNLPGGASNR